MADLTVQDHGSVFLLVPHTDAGQAWIDEYLPDDTPTLGQGYGIEHRYIVPIVQGAIADGLEVGG